MRKITFIALLCALPLQALADDLISHDKAAYDAIDKEAVKIENDPEAINYRHNKFSPYFSQRYSAVMSECFKTLSGASGESFAFVLTLDKAGKVQSIHLNKDTNVAECIAAKIAKDSFPPPPFAPFSEEVDQDFAH